MPMVTSGGREFEDASANARLAAIVDSSFDAIIGKDLNSTITDWNRAAERMFGYSAEEAIGQSMLLLIPEHMHDEETDIISRIRRGEGVANLDTMRKRKDGSLVAVSVTVSPIRSLAGEIVGASTIARDITAARENERRIRLLMREVNHRVKNQFAVILSMVRETNKRSASPSEFEEMIRARIISSNSLGLAERLLVSLTIDRITANWFFTRWLTSRIRSRMRRSFSLAAVMSRAIVEAPTISPARLLIGDTVTETATSEPSLRFRIVSRFATPSPRRMRLIMSVSSSCICSGIRSSIDWPMASSAL